MICLGKPHVDQHPTAYDNTTLIHMLRWFRFMTPNTMEVSRTGVSMNIFEDILLPIVMYCDLKKGRNINYDILYRQIT